MDIKGLVLYAILGFLVGAEENIYTLKHICPPQLSVTLRKYKCVYNQPSVSATPSSRGTGPIAECCHNKCSEHYLVTSYCKRSTIEFVTEYTGILNNIIKEENQNKIEQSREGDEVAREKIDNNKLTKEAPQVRKFKTLKHQNDGKFIRNKKKIKSSKSKNRKRVKIENGFCSCKRRKRKEEKTYKPSVIILSQISSNPPIPIQRRQ